MRKLLPLILLAFSACSESKDVLKGQVDESEPPGVPTELGKSDTAAKVVSVNVQSAHPYANDLNKVYPVSLAGLPSCASRARLHFKVLRTEPDYDFVTVEPAGGAPEEFTGTRDDTWSAWFAKNASTVNVRLESDYSITRHGFEIDKIEWDGAPTGCATHAQCSSSSVDLTQTPAACQCRPAPVCAPIANIEVAHHLARGFNNTTKRVNGAVATFTHPGPADGPETDTIGTVDTTRLAALVRRAAASGLLQGAGYTRPVAAGVTLDEFTISAGSYDVTFVAGEGSHSAEVQAFIDEFEALFTCGGGGLTCGSGYDCEQGVCVEQQTCVCTTQYAPVCGTDGRTYSNSCYAGCANAAVAHAGECGIVGDFCGGLMGALCADDNRCRYAPSTFQPPHPDASGTCVAPNYCDAPPDCNGLPHIAVPGAWACTANSCAWAAGPAWNTFAGGHFETANPYANNVSVWHQLYLPAEAQMLRLRANRFRTEAGYDKLEVWTWQNGAWTKIRTYSGTTGPALTDQFPGRYHYLRFVSDSSVTDQGVSVDGEWR